MMKVFRFILPAVAALGLAGTAYAEGSSSAIDGYYRIKNTGKDASYISITGPFTASPEYSLEDARKDAGTILYVDAVPTDVEGEYLLNHLRSQGVDLFGTPTGDFMDHLMEIFENGNGLSYDTMFAMVQQGMRDGYVSVVRNMVEGMIYMVCTRLGSEKLPDNLPADITKPESEDLEALANLFAAEVGDKLNLNFALRYNGKLNGEDTFNIYYDFPTFDIISEWYKKEENHDLMRFGMYALGYMFDQRDYPTGEIFTAADIARLKDWGYDITEKYEATKLPKYVLGSDFKYAKDDAGNRITDGTELQVETTYDAIFSDPDLLFNWIKLGLYKLDRKEANVEIADMELGLIFDELRKHSLTAMFCDYIPDMNAGERYYIINGNNKVDGKNHYGLEFTAEKNFEVNNAEGWGNWTLEEVTAATALQVETDVVVPYTKSNSPYLNAEYPVEKRYINGSWVDQPAGTTMHVYDYIIERSNAWNDRNEDQQVEMPSAKAEESDLTSKYYTTVYFDFPVKIANEEVEGITPSFFALSEEPEVLTEDPFWNSSLYDPYNVLGEGWLHVAYDSPIVTYQVEKTGISIERKVPAIAGFEVEPSKTNEVAPETYTVLNFVPDYTNKMDVVEYVPYEEPTKPENSFVIGGDNDYVISGQKIGRRHVARVAPSEKEPISREADGLEGIMLGRTSGAEDLKRYNGLIIPSNYKVHVLEAKNDVAMGDNKLAAGASFAFSNNSVSLRSNSAIYVAPSAKTVSVPSPASAKRVVARAASEPEAFYAVGTPKADDTVTTDIKVIPGAALDEAAEGEKVYYNLQGIKVANPVEGQIYIVNGKKVVF